VAPKPGHSTRSEAWASIATGSSSVISCARSATHRLEHLEGPDDPLPALETLGLLHRVNSVREDAEQVVGALIEASPVILR